MKIDLTDPVVVKQMGETFNFYARYCNALLKQEDLDYLLNNIKKHPCFELIDKAYHINEVSLYSVVEIANAKINQIVFYDKFYNDSSCPPGIKLVLFTYLGVLRYDTEALCPNLLHFRSHYVEQWLEIASQKLSE